MVTAAGDSAFIGGLSELAELNWSAVDAFEAASPRMHRLVDRCRMGRFLEDHRRCGAELEELARELGADVGVRRSRSVRERLFPGGIVADRLILEVMKRNEEELFSAFEAAVSQPGIPERMRASLERTLAVERGHRAFLADQLVEVEGLLLLPL